MAGISKAQGWTRIVPDAHGDWLRQRDDSFERFLVLGDKSRGSAALFGTYSNGVKTQRDAWVFNPSRHRLSEQVGRMVGFYNAEVSRFASVDRDVARNGQANSIDDFVDADPAKISWTRALKGALAKGSRLDFAESRMVSALYRPFLKTWLYYDRRLNDEVGQMPRLFPSARETNRLIMVKQGWRGEGFLALLVDAVPELQTDGGTQCFPLRVYENATVHSAQTDLYATREAQPTVRDGITDEGYMHFAAAYGGEPIGKEDVFYYVYGILHSADYRERYADNLGKELPRIPRVKTAADFWAFSKAGRELGELHVGYEKVPEHPATVEIAVKKPNAETYRVESMRFSKGEKVDGKTTKDKTTVVYNDFITVKNIPLEAYEYVVNGKSAIEWVMERQGVSTDKASGIVKDANDYAIETMNDPRYPLSLLLRVIAVSLETVRIVKALPALDIREDG